MQMVIAMIDQDEIKKYIPHRYPFLFVDQILNYEPNKSLRALKNVTHNEYFFQGHFPARAVMPGVIMIEAMAQAAGVLMAKSLDWPENHDNIFFLAGVDNARFKRVVEPGDQLVMDIETIKMRRDLWKVQGTATVEGELACAAEIMMVRGQ